MTNHASRIQTRGGSKREIVLAVGNMYEFNEQHNRHLRDSVLTARRRQKENFAVSAELALVWGGNIHSRVVVLPQQPHHLLVESVSQRLRVSVQTLSPLLKTGWVCRDLLDDYASLFELVRLLGHYSVHVIPWGATPDLYRLVKTLQEHGVEIADTEYSREESQWTASYLDSKVGSRSVIEHVGSTQNSFGSPRGYVCYGREEAARLAHTLAHSWNGCVVIKSNRGAGGRGIRIFLSSSPDSCEEEFEDYLSSLEEDELWHDVPIIVEEMIGARTGLSALTFDGVVGSNGEVDAKGIGNMLISDHRFYQGAEMGVDSVSPNIRSRILSIGLEIGKEIRSLGYSGWYDLDVLAPNSEDRLFGAEINARRTGPAHLIEFASQVDGPDWQQRRFYRINERLRLDRPLEGFGDIWDVFQHVHDDVVAYGAGVVPISSCGVGLKRPYMGYIIYASTRYDADEIEVELRRQVIKSRTLV